jgi:hypothetical protein
MGMVEKMIRLKEEYPEDFLRVVALRRMREDRGIPWEMLADRLAVSTRWLHSVLSGEPMSHENRDDWLDAIDLAITELTEEMGGIDAAFRKATA